MGSSVDPVEPSSARRRNRVGLVLGGVASVTVLAAAVLPSALASSKPSSVTAARPGCSSSRPAVAYGPDGKPLATQPDDAPIPCLVPTGYATVETHVGVTNRGTVLQEPAVITPGVMGTQFLPGLPGPHPSQYSPAGVAVSSNQGSSWGFVAPAGDYVSNEDNGFYIDPDTGRVFLEAIAILPPQGGQIPLTDQTLTGRVLMLTSPDDGKSWNYQPLVGFFMTENARYTVAPPAPGQALPSQGYPHVTYWCGNKNVGAAAPQAILDRECFRSLDGGSSWLFQSILFSKAPASECGTNQPFFGAYDGFYPEGAPDGSLYLMIGCTDPTSMSNSGGASSSNVSSVYLARSTDEAATWPVLQQPGSSPNVQLPVPAGASDPELRVATVDGRTVLVLAYLVTTQNGPVIQEQTAVVPPYTAAGALSQPLQWTPPIDLTPAGLTSIDRWAMDVRGSELALSYIAGTPASSSTVYDGYITMVPNVGSPAIWTAMVNDPNVQHLSLNAPQSARDDFIGMQIGPDGSPWASYFSPCSADPNAQTDPACVGAYFDGQPVNAQIMGGNDRGMVGSLLLRS